MFKILPNFILIMDVDRGRQRGIERNVLESMNEEMNDLMTRLGNISDHIENDMYVMYFDGDFVMTLLNGDVIHSKRIAIRKPPYTLGHYSEYFSFRLDKSGVKNIGNHWGDFTWFQGGADCFTQIMNGDRILR